MYVICEFFINASTEQYYGHFQGFLTADQFKADQHHQLLSVVTNFLCPINIARFTMRIALESEILPKRDLLFLALTILQHRLVYELSLLLSSIV